VLAVAPVSPLVLPFPLISLPVPLFSPTILLVSLAVTLIGAAVSLLIPLLGKVLIEDFYPHYLNAGTKREAAQPTLFPWAAELAVKRSQASGGVGPADVTPAATAQHRCNSYTLGGSVRARAHQKCA
jgi:hypothetical protein